MTDSVPKLVTNTAGAAVDKHVGAAQVADATHGQIVRHHRNQSGTCQQALAHRLQACMHARGLASSEGILAFLWRVVHVIFDLGTLANGLVAALIVGKGGRRVTHFIALHFAIGL